MKIEKIHASVVWIRRLCLGMSCGSVEWNSGLQHTFIVWEKKQNVLSLCSESIGTCFTPKITDASDKSSCINAPAFA